MSNIAMQGGATGTGTVTLLAPSTSTNRTLTLPDAAGTVALQGGAGVGKVLQVVNATYSTQVSTTSASYTSSGLTASITPTSASSKILVIFSAQVFLTSATATSKFQLYRNGSSVRPFEYTAYAGTSPLMTYPTCLYLDSPSTTSSTAYTVYFNSNSGSINVIFNYTDANGTPVSTITLMEIAA